MKYVLILISFLMMTNDMGAQDLNTFQWKNRVLLLFTPDEEDSVFQRQIALLNDQTEAMEDRQLITLFLTPGGDRENTQLFRKAELTAYYYDHFGVDERLFTLILVGLDGREKYRSVGRAVAPETLYGTIDQMPMRRAQLKRRGDGY
jgi:hypothetical protein